MSTHDCKESVPPKRTRVPKILRLELARTKDRTDIEEPTMVLPSIENQLCGDDIANDRVLIEELICKLSTHDRK